MKIIEPSYRIEWPRTRANAEQMLFLIEDAARTCYKSEPTEVDPLKVLTKAIKRGHESVIEHSQMTVRFVANRGFTHEEVRHRLCAYSQESTRYCNYSKDRFDSEVTFIDPRGAYPETSDELYRIWYDAMAQAEHRYFQMLKAGAPPERARGVLPIDVKTEIVHTANLRGWRHIFRLRAAKAAHPQMRQLMRPLLREARALFPVVFDDVGVAGWCEKHDCAQPCKTCDGDLFASSLGY